LLPKSTRWTKSRSARLLASAWQATDFAIGGVTRLAAKRRVYAHRRRS
jgi:hypothetical protein